MRLGRGDCACCIQHAILLATPLPLRKHVLAIFHGCKNGNFQMKKCDIFLIFAQNIDCGYKLEPPHCGGSNEYPQSMF